MKFGEQGEKTGWSYILVKKEIAEKLKPGNKKSFRVKGKLDEYSIKGIALVPMGEGNFIMAINATMRKAMVNKKVPLYKFNCKLIIQSLNLRKN
ncbi:MAG: DUF1905 domain-containing protein [Ferruginibacter sp.]